MHACVHPGTVTSAYTAGSAEGAAASTGGIVTVQAAIGMAGGVALLLAVAIVAIVVLALCLIRAQHAHRKGRNRTIPLGAVRWTDEDTCSIQSASSSSRRWNTPPTYPSISFENKLYAEASVVYQGPDE